MLHRSSESSKPVWNNRSLKHKIKIEYNLVSLCQIYFSSKSSSWISHFQTIIDQVSRPLAKLIPISPDQTHSWPSANYSMLQSFEIGTRFPSATFQFPSREKKQQKVNFHWTSFKWSEIFPLPKPHFNPPQSTVNQRTDEPTNWPISKTGTEWCCRHSVGGPICLDNCDDDDDDTHNWRRSAMQMWTNIWSQPVHLHCCTVVWRWAKVEKMKFEKYLP